MGAERTPEGQVPGHDQVAFGQNWVLGKLQINGHMPES